MKKKQTTKKNNQDKILASIQKLEKSQIDFMYILGSCMRMIVESSFMIDNKALYKKLDSLTKILKKKK